MKKFLIVLLSVGLVYACSSDRQEKGTATGDDNLNENVETKVVADVENVGIASTSVVNDLISTKKMEAKRILSKRINQETFNSDMNVIEESGLYDTAICESLRRSYKVSRSYAANNWTMTYQQALDASKEGVEKAKKLERLRSDNL